MTRAGEWERMREVVTDDMLARFVPRGTYDDIAAVYRERYAGLARRVTFPVPDDPADDARVVAVLRQLQAA